MQPFKEKDPFSIIYTNSYEENILSAYHHNF